MAVVPASAAYIIANYKETQLTDVRPGQPATIAVDMFPGVTFHGHVDSIAPASGQEFALLPPDNATGNFTKVVQRIPVKIVLDPTARSRRAAPRHVGHIRPSIPSRRSCARPLGQCARADVLTSEEARSCRDHSSRGRTRLARRVRSAGRHDRQSEPDRMDRRHRQHDRRLHGDPQHPDHQCVAARHRRRHRHRRRQWRLDFDRPI